MGQNKSRQNAFTIVELLIVIVVIGILAAISIVSYNGIQNRARDTAVKNSASQVRTKIEAWNSITGSYPAVGANTSPAATSIRGGLVDTTNAPEARIDAEVVAMIAQGTSTIATTHATGSPNTIVLTACSTTGVRITYFQAGVTPNPSMVAGVC